MSDQTLPTIDSADLSTATGGSTHFYPTRCAANAMATQLRNWNPDLRYDVRQAKNQQWYVSNPYKPTAPQPCQGRGPWARFASFFNFS